MSDDYTLSLVDPTTPSADLDAWTRAVALGFLEADLSPEQLAKQQEWLAADKGQLRQATRTHPRDIGALTQPVATFRSWEKTINTGAGHLEPANLITDVTVRQTERRRGLLRRLMTADLTEARDRGLSLAALTVTEASIYSRFGFGAATLVHSMELDISHGFALWHQPEGSIVQLDPGSEQTAATWARLDQAFHHTHRGSHESSVWHRDHLLGRFDWKAKGPDLSRRTVAHLGPDGGVDGFLAYCIKDEAELRVEDLIALNPEAELGLWAFIGHHDLLRKATFTRFSPASPLRWALADQRRLKVTAERDGIWLRILDPVAALAVRGFDHEGEITIGVRDTMELAAGVIHLRHSAGQTEVGLTDAEPDLTCDVDTLASLYLGGVDAQLLARAGRLHGDQKAISRAAELFRVDQAPTNLRYF